MVSRTASERRATIGSVKSLRFGVAAGTILAGCGWLSAGQAPGGGSAPASIEPRAAEATIFPGATASPEATAATEPSPAPSVEPDKRFAFALPDEFRLFYWDPPSIDVYPIPAVGAGVFNVALIDDDRRVVFDQAGSCWAWDLASEMKFRIPTAVSPCIDPSFSADANLMLFHDARGVYLWFREDWPFATGSIAFSTASMVVATASGTTSADVAEGWKPSLPTGSTVELTKFGPIAADHGGILDANLDGAARTVIAVTGDGLLWQYLIREDRFRILADLRAVGDGVVTSIYLDPSGTHLTFASGPRLFLYHLDSRLLDPIPYANNAYDAVAATAPVWISSDEFHYLATDAAGRLHLLRYHWRSELVRTATILGGIFASGIHLLSDP